MISDKLPIVIAEQHVHGRSTFACPTCHVFDLNSAAEALAHAEWHEARGHKVTALTVSELRMAMHREGRQP